jgi:hypothetical protein
VSGMYVHRRPMWRSSGNTPILRKRSRVRLTHCANICVHMSVGLGLGVSFYNMYVFKKIKYILIRYLESITQAL